MAPPSGPESGAGDPPEEVVERFTNSDAQPAHNHDTAAATSSNNGGGDDIGAILLTACTSGTSRASGNRDSRDSSGRQDLRNEDLEDPRNQLFADDSSDDNDVYSSPPGGPAGQRPMGPLYVDTSLPGRDLINAAEAAEAAREAARSAREAAEIAYQRYLARASGLLMDDYGTTTSPAEAASDQDGYYRGLLGTSAPAFRVSLPLLPGNVFMGHTGLDARPAPPPAAQRYPASLPYYGLPGAIDWDDFTTFDRPPDDFLLASRPSRPYGGSLSRRPPTYEEATSRQAPFHHRSSHYHLHRHRHRPVNPQTVSGQSTATNTASSSRKRSLQAEPSLTKKVKQEQTVKEEPTASPDSPQPGPSRPPQPSTSSAPEPGPSRAPQPGPSRQRSPPRADVLTAPDLQLDCLSSDTEPDDQEDVTVVRIARRKKSSNHPGVLEVDLTQDNEESGEEDVTEILRPPPPPYTTAAINYATTSAATDSTAGSGGLKLRGFATASSSNANVQSCCSRHGRSRCCPPPYEPPAAHSHAHRPCEDFSQEAGYEFYRPRRLRAPEAHQRPRAGHCPDAHCAVHQSASRSPPLSQTHPVDFTRPETEGASSASASGSSRSPESRPFRDQRLLNAAWRLQYTTARSPQPHTLPPPPRMVHRMSGSHRNYHMWQVRQAHQEQIRRHMTVQNDPPAAAGSAAQAATAGPGNPTTAHPSDYYHHHHYHHYIPTDARPEPAHMANPFAFNPPPSVEYPTAPLPFYQHAYHPAPLREMTSFLLQRAVGGGHPGPRAFSYDVVMGRFHDNRAREQNHRGASKASIERNTFPHKFKKVPREKNPDDEDEEGDKCTICLCGKCIFNNQ